MHGALTIGRSITSESALSSHAGPIDWSLSPKVEAALADEGAASRELDRLQRRYRAATLASVATGKRAAADALAQIDAVRRLDYAAHHAWRAAAHLLGRGAAQAGPDGLWPADAQM